VRTRNPGPAIDLARPAADRAALLRLIGGRQRYNTVRRDRATLRRAELVGLLLASAPGAWPIQRVLAARLGVHRSTISRDLAEIVRLSSASEENRLAALARFMGPEP